MKYLKTDLFDICLDITVYGIVLSFLTTLNYHQLDIRAITTICCFLACVFVFKIFYPRHFFEKSLFLRFGIVVGCGAFMWALIYYATLTRIGWYRFHVLQQRVQQLISNAPAYVIMTDTDGFITGTSDNIDTLIGWSKKEIVGKHCTILMRKEVISRHTQGFNKAVTELKDVKRMDAGWVLQGVMTVGLRRKDGALIPVQLYAGGIRWSDEISFKGDTDMFAVLIPANIFNARFGPTTIPFLERLKIAPKPAHMEEGIPLGNSEQPRMAIPGTQGKVIIPSTDPNSYITPTPK